MNLIILRSSIQVKKTFEFWEKNSVWFCANCWDYLEMTSSFMSPGPMSHIWLHNVEQRTLLSMHMLELKYKCIGEKCDNSLFEVLD